MKTLHEVIAEHRFLAFRIIDGDEETGEGHQAIPMCVCGWEGDDWPVHVAAAYREARTITTREQLDALLSDAVIRDDHGDDWMRAGDVGGNPAWWLFGSEEWLRTRDIALPVIVLWTPGDTP